MWIKLWADHGGGHQSHSEKYLWFDEEPSREMLRDMWEDWTDTEYMSGDIIGDGEIVEKPPVKEIEYLLSEYRAQEEYAHKMIRILEGCSIPELPTRDYLPTKAGWGYPLLGKKWHYFNNDWISLCGKWMYTGELEDRTDLGDTRNCRACTKKLEKLNKKKEN